eukprot:scaffold16229_cov79-Isochrysis_galbana.AAC.1
MAPIRASSSTARNSAGRSRAARSRSSRPEIAPRVAGRVTKRPRHTQRAEAPRVARATVAAADRRVTAADCRARRTPAHRRPPPGNTGRGARRGADGHWRGGAAALWE